MPSNSKKTVMVCGAVVMAFVVGGIGVTYASHSGGTEKTNDAFVSADFTVVAPRVAGEIVSLAVGDNQQVRKGQKLADIDDRDYVAAVALVTASVATAEARVQNADASVKEQSAMIAQAVAATSASRADYVFAKANFARYKDLAEHGAGSAQNAQRAQAQIDVATAKVAQDKASLDAAHEKSAVLLTLSTQARGELQHARAALDLANLSLSYTHITAPIDGIVGQRAIRTGAYVQAGTPLLAIVPLHQAYVIANFQETQLTHVVPGQSAHVSVDTFPGVVFDGQVDSVAPATGVTFAILAPDNATGNFTKVVQRIPVKIVLMRGQPALDRLRVGMSVEASIDATAGDRADKRGEEATQ